MGILRTAKSAYRALGFTLLELVIYIGLLSMVSVLLIQSLLALSLAYRRIQGERDVVASMRIAIETLARETQAAKGIYTPTSVFGGAPSQLSLETTLDPTASEDHTYVDFYVDNQRLYLKREGSQAIALTSESVSVTRFTVSRITAGARETAEITLEIHSRNAGALDASSLVQAGFTPRGVY